MIAAGQYKGRGIKSTVQLGETEGNNTLQVAIDVDVLLVKGDTRESLGTMTTFLYFSEAAAPYSFERLRALGWKGQGPDDVDSNMVIDINEVDVRVTQAEPYTAPDGTKKMGTSKLEILTGGGKVVISKKLDDATFKARLRAIVSGSGGSSASAPKSGGAPPPF